MLVKLSIKNYALIDSLAIEFSNDLNTLTGETGAGKSILLGAIGLIIGQRADSSVLRDKNEKCTVEGVFNISDYGLQNFFVLNELDYDDLTIVRREISVQGKSRAFINDTPVNVKVLNELGLKLIDIHSQHQNLELNEKKYQLKLVDVVAQNELLIKNYLNDFKIYQSLGLKLEKVLDLAEQSKKDLDYYQFQFSQLFDAKLIENEQTELEQELEKLEHAEEIKLVFGLINQTIVENENSVSSVLKENLSRLSKLRNIINEASQIYDRLDSVYLELKDIANDSSIIENRVENDPDKINKINQRLDLIYSLQQKHRVISVSELLDIQNNFESKIQLIGSYDTEIEMLKNEIKRYSVLLKKQADSISEKRISVSKMIENKVIEVLKSLGIPNVSFKLNFAKLSDFNETGTDDVSFMFSANMNQELQEIGKIASGGEMSRLMLAIKTLITDAKSLPTIIFDEIDTGVSGEIALKMGQILEKMAHSVQVLNITHLAQIASKGKHHYRVFKFDENNQTFTAIKKLTEKERVEEIAQMLSGENFTSTTIETAKELLK